MPNFAISRVVERKPPVDTSTPASIAKVVIGSGITARCHSDSGGVEELEDDMLRGPKMESW